MSKSNFNVPPGKALQLGWLLGERFLLLIHIGRSSGLPRGNINLVYGYKNRRNAHSVRLFSSHVPGVL